MDNTENMKETKEIIASDNEDMATAKSDIVVSENGGFTPNASAAMQKLFQSWETNDKYSSEVSNNAILAAKEIAKDNPNVAPEAIDSINKTVKAERDKSIVKTIVGGATVVVGFALGFCAGVMVKSFTCEKQPVQYVDLSDENWEEESEDEDTDENGHFAS